MINAIKSVTTRNGALSTSKVWRHIAFGVASYAMIVNAKGIDWELLLVYMAVVSGSEIAKLALTQKTGITTSKTTSEVINTST